jgi:hypothetical protein
MKKMTDTMPQPMPGTNSPYMVAGQKKPDVKKITREEMRKKMEEMRERDEEMVTGIFKNLENPAQNGGRGVVQFGFKKYHGDYTFYELLDGERYTLPRMVARHLNNDCYYREYQHLPGEFGEQGMRMANPSTGPDGSGRMLVQSKQASRKVHRYAFHSLEYMDDDPEMYPANIIEVTVSP